MRGRSLKKDYCIGVQCLKPAGMIIEFIEKVCRPNKTSEGALSFVTPPDAVPHVPGCWCHPGRNPEFPVRGHASLSLISRFRFGSSCSQNPRISRFKRHFPCFPCSVPFSVARISAVCGLAWVVMFVMTVTSSVLYVCMYADTDTRHTHTHIHIHNTLEAIPECCYRADRNLLHSRGFCLTSRGL